MARRKDGGPRSDSKRQSYTCLICGTVRSYGPARAPADPTDYFCRPCWNLHHRNAGARNPMWKGEQITSSNAGHTRARRLYPTELCNVCGESKVVRHHIDGNHRNNAADNVEFLCYKHHARRHHGSGQEMSCLSCGKVRWYSPSALLTLSANYLCRDCWRSQHLSGRKVKAHGGQPGASQVNDSAALL